MPNLVCAKAINFYRLSDYKGWGFKVHTKKREEWRMGFTGFQLDIPMYRICAKFLI
jgi:hypothetical protein